MQYMIIETFRNGPSQVYERFRAKGRMAPEGLQYDSSVVTEDGHRCFQLMTCDDRSLIDQWIANWSDIVDFEVIPVITSAEAAAAFGPR
ncbi:MAG TPA: DUF3303 family protein [Gemmatimonadaceae bacterium]|jgi:hypothetical protein